MNQELPDVEGGFRKGRGTRDQIANICYIIKKARESQNNTYFCFIDYAKATVWTTTNSGKFLRVGSTRPPDLLFEKSVCRSRSNSLELYKKDLHNPDNHDGVITHLELDILEYEVKWALGSITMSKASGSDAISVELFQILKDDAVKVVHSICQ